MIRSRNRSKILPGCVCERCARPAAHSSSSLKPARREAISIRSHALAALAAGSSCRILGFGLELDPKAVGERLERAREVQPLGLHHEVERVPRGLAAEAVIEPVVRADVKRGRALIVEWAQPEVAV